MKEGAVFYFEKRATGKTEVVTYNAPTPYGEHLGFLGCRGGSGGGEAEGPDRARRAVDAAMADLRRRLSR